MRLCGLCLPTFIRGFRTRLWAPTPNWVELPKLKGDGGAFEFLRDRCLDLPGTMECFPFGPDTAVYKVQASDKSAAKVFALLWPRAEGASINLKCEPELAVQLRQRYPAVTPGYHMNKRHWNSVELANADAVGSGGLTAELAADMIEDSYDLVVSSLPRKDRLLLGWSSAQ